MLTNIVDRRSNPYRWREVTAVFEPTAQDNVTKKGSDEAARPPRDWSHEELERTTVQGAINYANALSGPTTVYIYDLGDGIGERKVGPDGEMHDPGMIRALTVIALTGSLLLLLIHAVFYRPDLGGWGFDTLGDPTLNLVASAAFVLAGLYGIAGAAMLFGLFLRLATYPRSFPKAWWRAINSWRAPAL